VRVDEHTIEVAGSPAFFRSAPATGVPALYLHGVPTSSDDWTGLLERTGGIAPDLPGFGRSGKGGHLDYSLEGQADFLEALLGALELERVQLVGHDWGAAAGLVFAQRHPHRIQRMVLCNALPLLDGFRWRGLARAWRTPALGELVMGAVNRRLLARTLRGASASAGAWPDTRIAAVWEQFDQGTQRAILRMHRSCDEQQLAAAGAGLGELEMDVLIVWGERDPWFPAQFADEYARRFGHSTVLRLADAGHWPWLDRPDAVEEIVAFVGDA
jgi:pimeloyl-ACP methyl ester carboxylesterase